MVDVQQDFQVSERLERFRTWPWPYTVLVIVGAAYFFGLFDVLTIGTAAPTIGAQMGVAGEVVASNGTVFSLVGYAVGAFLFSHISDTLGRKRGLTVSLIAYSVGSILTATATDITQVYVWRFVTGIGIGADLAIAAAYLSELAPHNNRGKFQSLGTFFGFTGAGVAPLIGYFLIPPLDIGWRIFFIIGALGGIFVLFIRKNVPESPRWLLSKGRAKEASELLDKIEITYKSKYGDLPPLSEMKAEIVESEMKVPLLHLFSKKHGLRLALVLAVFLFYYLYTYPFLALTTSLLVHSGFSIVASLFMVGLGGLGYAVGAFSAFLTTERIERKYLISILFVLQGICMFGIAIKLNTAEIIISDFFGSLTNTFLATTLYVYAAENFPTRARSNGVAATDGVGHLAPVFGLPFMIGFFGMNGFFNTYLLIGIIAIVGGIVVLAGIRSTGRKLEELSE
ncbi:hypothetical protein IX51_02950 [uncultured archaeon]|nr:hypothetical protein IX51_02950 [uncultured archaeon]